MMASSASSGFAIRSILVTILLQLTRHVSAQNTDPYFAPAFSQLPADLRSYLSAQAEGTAVAAAIIGDFVTEPDDVIPGDDGRRGPVYSEAVPFIQAALTQFQRAATATAVPSDQQAILASVVRVISADIATDGLLGSVAAATTGGPMTATTPADATRPGSATGSTTVGATPTASTSGQTTATAPASSGPTARASTIATTTSSGMASVGFGTTAFTGLQLLVMSVAALFIQ